MDYSDLKTLLDETADHYNQPSFIERDPISIPHRFSNRADIEIMGFWAAVLAWGQRPVILRKANELVELMDGAPYDFVRNHQDSDLTRFLAFKHRTFNATDTLYFLYFFRHYYRQHDSLENAFLPVVAEANHADDQTVEAGLIAFHNRFCGIVPPDASPTDEPVFPERTRKHIASPARGSTCKRLLMFLRWMVRQDSRGVDFGIWTRIRPDQLIIPIDVHVGRVATKLGLLASPGQATDKPKPPTWRTALDLTQTLRQFDSADPVRYDFALFGLGVEGVL
jgi:uncharacterized protein (TIGR02757 family)